ncbi:MAG: gliding motility lipoprotein GldH [Flavobacteriales bacterium]|nr:gliding motility lipoprotein GldH [Flavobacteriales bacterium]
MCAALLISCDDNMVFEQNQEIDGAVWSWDEPVRFQFQVSDTVSRHNFYINLRNGNDYPYSNMFLFVTLNFPNGKKSVDTVECFLADQAGRWYGTGMGNMHDNRFLYKQNKQFPLAGNYRIEIHQAMRQDDLPDIHDVGFRLSRGQ